LTNRRSLGTKRADDTHRRSDIAELLTRRPLVAWAIVVAPNFSHIAELNHA
jgi:hypothetical protein